MTLDIPKGRILSVIVLAPGNFKTKSVIPAMALSFNATRDALLLDDTKLEYADEPRYVFTEGPSATRPTPRRNPTRVRTLRSRSNRAPVTATWTGRFASTGISAPRKSTCRHMQVGTINGRVTLRGWVDTERGQAPHRRNRDRGLAPGTRGQPNHGGQARHGQLAQNDRPASSDPPWLVSAY